MENLDLTYGDKIKITWVHDDAKELYSVGDIKKIVGYSCCNRGDYLVDSNKKGHKISYIGNKDNQWSTYRVDYELFEKRSNIRKFKKGDTVCISSIPGYEDYLIEFFIVGSTGVIKRDDGENKFYLVEFKEGRWWIDEDYLQIQKEENMKRFENVQVGDLVYDEVFGDGEITQIDFSKKENYCIRVKFLTVDYSNLFTIDGKMHENAIKPTLFYRKGDQRNLTKRPEPEKEIDWKEWEDKEILVRNDEISEWRNRKLYRYQPEFKRKFACYPNNCFNEEPLSFEQAKLIEKLPDLEIDWSKAGGASVYVSDSKEFGPEKDLLAHPFAFYVPNHEYPYWVYDGQKDNAAGFKYCVLAEPCKPEWIKK